MRLDLTIGSETFSIVCHPERAPRTLAALAASLPHAYPLHTPKIAGGHVYWHAPFVEDLEAAADVMLAPPGSFLYWPERQFLELIFAPLQAETAAITILGAVEAGADQLFALGERVRNEQGRRLVGAHLCLAEGDAPRPGRRPVAPALIPIRRAREAMDRTCPPEIARLMEGRGIMHPLGPLVFAESEARGLHEWLWWLRRDAQVVSDGHRSAAALACRKAASRIGGFCHLTETAAALVAAADAFDEPSAPLRAVYDESILLVGRLAAWLDQQVPWDDLNLRLRAVQEAR